MHLFLGWCKAPHAGKSSCRHHPGQPAYGQMRVSNDLKLSGIFVSPGGVRSTWQRYDLRAFRSA